MAKPRKKILPKTFEVLLREGNLADLKDIFNSCDVNARGGYGKQSALAFDECPDDLARWLVAQGADLSATDTCGNTPLHTRARSRKGRIGVLLELGADVNSATSSIGTPLHAAADGHNADNIRLLIRHGAKVDELNKEGLTPLELALQRCANIHLQEMVLLAKVLLDAGARRTPRTKELVENLGKNFEFHRSGFNPETVNEASEALYHLYKIFEVPPVPPRLLHDGESTICVRATTWQEQHEELWSLLVPGSGAAATVQGEVIRISGRISDELERNGGRNWDADYNKMADAFVENIKTGEPLPTKELLEALRIVADVKSGYGDTAAMVRLAVRWVLLNPEPVRLRPPAAYRR